MLHKMGFDCLCESCKQPKTFDQIAEDESGWCKDCRDRRIDPDILLEDYRERVRLEKEHPFSNE